MQYPILGRKEKKKIKEKVPKVIFQYSGLYARPFSIAFITQLQAFWTNYIFWANKL